MRFQTLLPGNREEALSLLKDNKGELLPVAGGTNVLVDLRRGKIAPRALVDLSRIEDGKELSITAAELVMGPLVTHADLANLGLAKTPLAALGIAAGSVGSPQIRNRGTVAGNLQSASPAADLATPLLALDADLTLTGSDGERSIKVADFFRGPGQTALTPAELISKITVKINPGANSVFFKVGKRNALAISVINLAACLEFNEDGTCRQARIALGAVAPTPVRAASVEAFIRGKKLDPEVVAEARELVQQDISPLDDLRAEAAYRRHLAAVLVGRALTAGTGLEECKNG